MKIPSMYLIVFIGRNTIHHAVSVVIVINSHSFFFSSVLYSAAKAASNLDVIHCHVLFVMFSIQQLILQQY